MIKISKFISNFFNPIVSLLIFLIYHCTKIYTLNEALQYALSVIFIMVLPTTFWIKWNVKKGKYSNFDVSNQHQRRTLYRFIFVVMIIFIIIQYLIKKEIDYIAIHLFTLIFIMHLSNFYIKSSMHTAFNLFTAALFYKHNPNLGFIWLIITILIGISRVILKRHTIQEVIMGITLAFFVSISYIYINS